MHWSVFIKDNDMKTSSETDDDGPNCVSSSGLWLQKNFSTNLIWNFRLCFMVSLAQVLWQLKSMMCFPFPLKRVNCCPQKGDDAISVDDVSIIFEEERFRYFLRWQIPSYLSNIPTISTEYGHCIDWIHCGFWNQLQSSTTIHHKTSKLSNWNTFVKPKIRKTDLAQKIFDSKSFCPHALMDYRLRSTPAWGGAHFEPILVMPLSIFSDWTFPANPGHFSRQIYNISFV